MTEATHADLHAIMDLASATVASWPQRKRDFYRELLKPSVDLCRCPRRCDEAQTCVAGCVYSMQAAVETTL